MTARTRRLLAVAAVGLCLFASLSVWAVTRVVAWASDLPNRIDIQVDSESVTRFVAESARATLKEGDANRQLEALMALNEGMKAKPDMVPWVRTELAPEIARLRQSPDPRVATLAKEVHAHVAPP